MILSCDIGLRNLSFCIVSAGDLKDISTYEIHLWDTYDTIDSEDFKCQGVQKNGNVCGKNCSYKHSTESDIIYSCKLHFPKETPVKKENHFKKKVIKDYPLQEIVSCFLKRVQGIYTENFEIFSKVDEILIELQPAINPSMKLISNVLYGKFIDLYSEKDVSIKFVRANSKLKAYTGPEIKCHLKGLYSQRKWLSLKYAEWILDTKFSKEQGEKWTPVLLAGKADNSDTLLYCINGLYGIPKNFTKDPTTTKKLRTYKKKNPKKEKPDVKDCVI